MPLEMPLLFYGTLAGIGAAARRTLAIADECISCHDVARKGDYMLIVILSGRRIRDLLNLDITELANRVVRVFCLLLWIFGNFSVSYCYQGVKNIR